MQGQNYAEPVFQNPFAHTIPVNAASFGAKFQSKGEVYRFLTHDCGTYLPKYDTVTVYHMKELASG